MPAYAYPARRAKRRKHVPVPTVCNAYTSGIQAIQKNDPFKAFIT